MAKKEAVVAQAKAPETPRLKKQYVEVVRDELQKKFEYKNVMQIPKIEKMPASPSLPSTCVRARPSAPRSPCAATVCGSSWTV